MTREATNKLIELIDDGMIDARTVLMSALGYMSEDDVSDMARCEGYIDDEDDEDE